MTRLRPIAAAVVVLLVIAGAASADPGDRVKRFGFNGWVDAEGIATSQVEDLVVQPDGRVIAVLSDDDGDAFVVVRLTRDGSFDPTFNFSGVVETRFGENSAHATAVALQRDGKIVVAGESFSREAMVVTRLLRDGRLDDTFGKNGKRVLTLDQPQPLHVGATGVAVQRDGKIVLTGFLRKQVGQTLVKDFVATRLKAGGAQDSSFGEDGWRAIDLGGDDTPEDMFLSDGKITIVGWTRTSGQDDWALARLTAGGDPDPDYGAGYKVIDAGGEESAYAAAPTSDGGLVLAGRRSGAGVVARITSEGFFDGGFAGGAGWEAIAGAFEARGVDVQPDGKIVAAGSGNTGAETELHLVRLTPTGSPDPSFGTNGYVIGSPPDSPAAFNTLDIGRDNQIVTGGLSNLGDSAHLVFGRFLTGIPPGCTIAGGPGPDSLVGGPGRDFVCGLGGKDDLSGGRGDDVVVGGPGGDILHGDGGNDRVFGGDGDDGLFGDDGRDRLDGGAGRDTCNGGAGRDGSRACE